MSDSAETYSAFRRGAKPFHVLLERDAAPALGEAGAAVALVLDEAELG